MRRGLLLIGVWLLGTCVAVTFSFAAVGRVANGVARSNVAALSSRAIRDKLSPVTSNVGSARSSTTRSPVPLAGPTSATPTSTSATTSTVPPSSPSSVPTTGPAPTMPSSSSANDTATTSQGGTIWTHCSGPDSIVFVAAIPNSGYQRTVDVEDSSGVDQEFENGSRRSTIHAACSNGIVHAEVEVESADN